MNVAAMNRHRAAAIHLALSATIVGAALTTALLLWYPDAWFESMGGKNLILILAGVDITLGPLLTWVIFRPGKKGLKFDLTFIACVQFSAFLYGFHVLHAARPVYMVLVVDQFRAVTAIEIDPADLAKNSFEEFRRLPLDGPRVAGSNLPTDPKEREALMMASITSGLDLHQLPQYWKPYDGREALRVAASLKSLEEISPANRPAIEAFLRKSTYAAEDLRFIPLRTRTKEMAALLDGNTGAVLGIIDAQPWR